MSSSDRAAASEVQSDAQFVAVGRRKGAAIRFRIDGHAISAHSGESVLSAALQSRHILRRSEFTGEPRAGFCLMSACQDCWMWSAEGKRLRACSTPVTSGLDLYTSPPTHLKGGKPCAKS
ncbi:MULTISPECIES: (2Fe-2S)-binding protein [Nitratireductor]|uniref:(2Fe-2S)-binding protein n=1 Tax=Nitratireductor TaxID=245876 RepID=UPI0032FC244B